MEKQTTADIRGEILGLEKKYWTAMREQDLETALGLTDFPCIVASPHGARLVERDQFIQMFKSHDGQIRNFKLNEEAASVRMIGADTAVIAYDVESTFTHEGQEKTISAVDTSTWIKRGDTWVCAMHTEIEKQKH